MNGIECGIEHPVTLLYFLYLYFLFTSHDHIARDDST